LGLNGKLYLSPHCNFKGHWWNAKTLLTLGSPTIDVYSAYLDGYMSSKVAMETKLNFLLEALSLLKDMSSKIYTVM